MKKLAPLLFGLFAFSFLFSCIGQKKQGPDSNNQTDSISNEGAISWTASVSNKYWLAEGDDRYAYIAIKVTGNEQKKDKKRVPLNISLVLDRSGSMEGDAMKFAKEAAKFVVKQLSSEDLLSIVNYDDVVEVTSPSQAVINKEILIDKIDKIYDRNSTNLSGGTLEGYKQVASTKKENYVNRVLLLTDGLANVGVTEPSQLNKIASSKFQETGIALSTFGLGASYDENLLTQMAESGRGNYYYIDRADKIPDIFAKELDGLLSVVAQNASVSIVLPAGVKCEKVYGYPHIESDGKIVVALNDIFAKEDKVFLLKVKIGDKAVSELKFPVQLDYVNAETFESKVAKKDLEMQRSSDKKLLVEFANKSVAELIALFESTDRFDAILMDVDNNNYNEAKNKASSEIVRLQELQQEAPSEVLEKQEKSIQFYLDNIDEVENMDREEKMKIQKTVKSDNYSVKKMKSK